MINIFLNDQRYNRYISLIICVQLATEIENLSWKIERAEMTYRGEQNQMDIAEKWRTTLLTKFQVGVGMKLLRMVVYAITALFSY